MPTRPNGGNFAPMHEPQNFEEAITMEELRTSLSAIRSLVAQIEQRSKREGVPMEKIQDATAQINEAKSQMFAARYSLGYP
jgi:hypothetical protein